MFPMQSLPKTSYYKLIDVWLLATLNVLVALMGMHTYVAHKCFLAKNQPFSLFRRY